MFDLSFWFSTVLLGHSLLIKFGEGFMTHLRNIWLSHGRRWEWDWFGGCGGRKGSYGWWSEESHWSIDDSVDAVVVVAIFLELQPKAMRWREQEGLISRLKAR